MSKSCYKTMALETEAEIKITFKLLAVSLTVLWYKG